MPHLGPGWRCAFVASSFFIAACGSKGTSKAPAPSSDGGAAESVPSGATSVFRPASSIAPLPMPPPPFFGSKVGVVRESAPFKEANPIHVTGKPPSDAASFARAFSSGKAKKVGSFTGKLEPAGAPALQSLAAKSGHCYRAYAAFRSGAVGTVSILDAAGATAAEGHPLGAAALVAAPRSGAVCFSSDDAAQVAVSVGIGEGDYALEIWSD